MSFKQHIKVGGFDIGASKVFIIAELGVNHQGSVAIAKEMIDSAKAAGADAVKLQAFKADEFISDKEQMYTYQSRGKKVSEPMYAMFKRYELSERDFKELFAYAKRKKILCFATPQNVSDMHMLTKFKTPLLKIGSDDLTNIPLLEAYARTNLPVIISTGMADLSDVEDAIRVFRKCGNDKLVVLHCISAYPAGADELNLHRITTLHKKFGVITGFSDHSQGIAAAIAATALGAKVIEKHMTLDVNMKGPDHRFSADPEELRELVDGVRTIEKALGSPVIRASAKEKRMRILARRSIVAAQDLPAGKRISTANIEYKRPGTGLMPKFSSRIVGKRTKKLISKGAQIGLRHIE